MSDRDNANTVSGVDLRKVSIRAAGQGDSDAILHMLEELFRDRPDGLSQDWLSSGDAQSVMAFYLDKGRMLVAEHADQVVGHISWRIVLRRPPLTAIRVAEIESLCIRVDYRGQQMAKKLCNAFLAECERQAITVAQINAHPDPATIALFRSCGFVEGGHIMVRTVKQSPTFSLDDWW